MLDYSALEHILNKNLESTSKTLPSGPELLCIMPSGPELLCIMLPGSTNELLFLPILHLALLANITQRPLDCDAPNMRCTYFPPQNMIQSGRVWPEIDVAEFLLQIALKM